LFDKIINSITILNNNIATASINSWTDDTSNANQSLAVVTLISFRQGEKG